MKEYFYLINILHYGYLLINIINFKFIKLLYITNTIINNKNNSM